MSKSSFYRRKSSSVLHEPLRRDRRRMLSKFARIHDTRGFVQLKCNLGLERQACALEDDFWREFVSQDVKSEHYGK